MNPILSVGLVLLAAVAAGHLAQRVRVPEVTGYLLIGIAIGPSSLDLVSASSLEALQFLSEIALGLILFSIGTIFEVRMLERVGAAVARITLSETLAAFLLVTGGMLLVGVPAAAALLLGIIAMETAPATTLMVLHEYDARGPLTDLLTASLAFNNMLVLVAFGIGSAVLSMASGPATSLLHGLLASSHELLWTIVGSAALGVCLGLLLDVWSRRPLESGEMMILTIGVVLLAVGAARALGLSPLFVTLTLGAVTANASRRSDELLEELRRADPPLYAAFFVLAGAELRPAMLASLGLAGGAYVLLRSIGKMGGATFAVRRTGLPAAARQYFGLSLLSSSSLAIGLTIQIRDEFPDLAPTITGIVLAAVIVFEIVGPLLCRFALVQAGEAQPRAESRVVA